MSKKKKPRKQHIRQAEFSDHNFSALESHPRQGKRLQSPYRQIPNVTFTSWRDDYLPNMLWAAVVATSLPREEYFSLFREIIGHSQEIERPNECQLVHTYLAALSPEDFLTIFEPLRGHPAAYSNLSSLRLIESLPDHSHWSRFTNSALPADPWRPLLRAIAGAFDHQSEIATDLRWVKVAHMLVSGRLKFGPEFSEQLEEIRLFPNYGDMRKVRPSVRAMEMSVRGFEQSEKLPHAAELFSEAFWTECRQKTPCVTGNPVEVQQSNPTEVLLDELSDLSIEIARHFDTATPGTSVDPRKDATFGLVLYSISILMEAAANVSHLLAGGRIFLRTITESFITLHYLAAKDDPTIWKQYRNYGIGQAKLSFLKLVREDSVPEFVSLQNLHDLANEDTWMEFQDIELGSWQGSDLRKMAEQTGTKDAYDRYYGWTSGFSHAHWTCVRDAAFTTCFNPLHRFHRIPTPPRPMPSILKDGCALINRMLGDLSMLYPPFNQRVRWHNSTPNPEPSPDAKPVPQS